ncbi:MAG TPA: M56 family metallopeptidase [Vicinamibacterales bacterium]|nr:M56 family metallopeptidase [Vicinamibacterales bacterium]
MMSWLPAALAAHLWQSTWFVGVVWLATLALRRHGARLRYWLWTAASVKFLVPFSWLISIGAQFDWRTAPEMARPAAAFVMKQVLSPSVLVAAPATLTQQTPVLPWLLVAVWLAGSAATLVRWWRQWLPVRAALRAAMPVTLHGEYDVTGIAVMASPEMFEPGVIGFRRPVLVVPEGLVERLTPAQMNALVAHERCHVRCHDNFVAAMHMAVEVIFWFHPLVWWIAARQVDERERACDEAVLRAGSRPSDYADSILTVCRWSLGSPVSCVSGITGSDLRTRIEMIMANRVGRRLNAMGRMLLVAAAAALVAGLVGVGLLDAEAQSSTPRPQFDVVSIKRTPEITGPGIDFAAMPGGRLSVRNNPVLNLIGNAYHFPGYRILGAPDWLTADRYDMEAKADGAPSRSEMMLMVQTLLEDRFKLRVHRETREGQVYVLSVAKGGLKLPPSKDGGCVDRSPGTVLPATERRPNCGNNWLRQRGVNLAWTATRIDMEGVAGALAIVMRRPVLDKTGASGFFDINVELPPLQPEVGVSDLSPIDTGVSVITILREQFGLSVDSGKGPVEYLVIDSVERPSEN